MKRIFILAAATLVCSLSFAGTQSSSKTSSTLSALGSAWKAQQSVQLTPDKDINMVYGGADVSYRPVISPSALA